MQELAPEVEVPGNAVDRVAGDGQADRLEMDADLMGPSGLEPDLEQRPSAEALAQLEPRDGVARGLRVEGATRPVTPVAADGRRDPPGAGAGLADDERQVAPLDLAVADRPGEALVRLFGACDDEQSGGVAVEAVDDARPIRIAAGGAEREQPVRQRRALVGPGGMDDEARRLVDDDQVLVLVDDRERELHRLELARLRELDGQLLTPGEPMALRSRPPVDEDGAGAHEPLGERSCPDSRDLGDDRIEAPARVRLRNARAVRCQRRRSSGRPPRTRGTAARPRRR